MHVSEGELSQPLGTTEMAAPETSVNNETQQVTARLKETSAQDVPAQPAISQPEKNPPPAKVIQLGAESSAFKRIESSSISAPKQTATTTGNNASGNSENGGLIKLEIFSKLFVCWSHFSTNLLPISYVSLVLLASNVNDHMFV